MEQGKDIIAVAPDGTPCAYQIMSFKGNISQKNWQDYLAEVIQLVEVPIKHPSITRPDRRTYLVVNGHLSEEVRREIIDRNEDWCRRGHPTLEVIVRGQLLDGFKQSATNIWPKNLESEKTLLQLYLSDGTDCLDKAALSNFLVSLLPFSEESIKPLDLSRALANVALFTTYALASYSDVGNHVALIEGWVIYVACLTAIVEKSGVGTEHWKDSLELAIHAIHRSLGDLIAEMANRKHLVQGDPLTDFVFYRSRITWLVGLVAAYMLYKDPTTDVADTGAGLIQTYMGQISLWGEGAIPHWLALYWYLRKLGSTQAAEDLLDTLVKLVCDANRQVHGLPDPYRQLADVADEAIGRNGANERQFYRGYSYMLEALVHLCARAAIRGVLQECWPQISDIHHVECRPDYSWQYCLWRIEDDGKLIMHDSRTPQSWSQLRNEADKIDVSLLPSIFRERPWLLLLFVQVFPHRLTTEVAKYLDSYL